MTPEIMNEIALIREALDRMMAEQVDIQTRLNAYQPGHWFPAATIDEMQAFYMSRLPAIREAARKCGYAVGLHGSTRRDFDLIAAPWIEECADPDTLVRDIQQAACGITQSAYEWERKPNGRIATSIPICWTEWHDMVSAGHIDLSVMPAQKDIHTSDTTTDGAPPDIGERYTIEHDGFAGTVIGSYRTKEGKEGVVLQQDGTRVVHVYGRKWLKAVSPEVEQ